MSKYTKGPWAVYHHESTDTYTIHVAGRSWESWSIAGVDDCTQDEANARLISAAPDLLEALQSYSLPIDMNNIAVSCIEFGNEAVEKELKRRAAIAKALGEEA